MKAKNIEIMITLALKGCVITFTYKIFKELFMLYKTQSCLYVGSLGIPKFWIIGIVLANASPIFIKLISDYKSKNKISDDTDLLDMFQRLQEINKE